MLDIFGLGHLTWEILPGAMGPGPWAPALGDGAAGPMGPLGPRARPLLQGPGSGPLARAHGPRQDLPGKVS